MPPFLLRSSAIISAAALAGTPKTEAGPDRNVVVPTLISAGLPCARAAPANSPVASVCASAVFKNFMKNPPLDLSTFMGPVGHLVILPRAATLPDYLRHCIALPEIADSAPEHGSAPVSTTGGAAQVGCRADGGPCAAGSQQG